MKVRALRPFINDHGHRIEVGQVVETRDSVAKALIQRGTAVRYQEPGPDRVPEYASLGQDGDLRDSQGRQAETRIQ